MKLCKQYIWIIVCHFYCCIRIRGLNPYSAESTYVCSIYPVLCYIRRKFRSYIQERHKVIAGAYFYSLQCRLGRDSHFTFCSYAGTIVRYGRDSHIAGLERSHLSVFVYGGYLIIGRIPFYCLDGSVRRSHGNIQVKSLSHIYRSRCLAHLYSRNLYRHQKSQIVAGRNLAVFGSNIYTDLGCFFVI